MAKFAVDYGVITRVTGIMDDDGEIEELRRKVEQLEAAQPSGLVSFLGRTPFAIAGAIGLLSLADGVIEYQHNIQTWLDVYKWFGDQVWPAIFGWFWDFLGFEMGDATKTYLTLGVTVTAGTMRVFGRDTKFDWPYIIMPLLVFIVWPVYLIFIMVMYPITSFFYWVFRREKYSFEIADIVIFLETFVYAGILLAINYAIMRV